MVIGDNHKIPVVETIRIVGLDDDGYMPTCQGCGERMSDGVMIALLSPAKVNRFGGQSWDQRSYCSHACALADYPECAELLDAAEAAWTEHCERKAAAFAERQQRDIDEAYRRLQEQNARAVKSLFTHDRDCPYCDGKGYTTIVEGGVHFSDRCGCHGTVRRENTVATT